VSSTKPRPSIKAVSQAQAPGCALTVILHILSVSCSCNDRHRHDNRASERKNDKRKKKSEDNIIPEIDSLYAVTSYQLSRRLMEGSMEKTSPVTCQT
jgi:hypothetical protein